MRAPDGTFSVHSVDRPVHQDTVRVAAEIRDSLYNAARRVGLPPNTLGEVTKILSWDVDFQRDLQPGDRFEVVLERTVNDRGQLVRAGDVAYVALDLQDRRIEAYRFLGRDGQAGYFDGEGRALRKSLLRTPIDGARISSPFGMRFHPILGYTRMHKGVDFAAPTGTPVFAAGDGVEEFVGRNRGYGKFVRIRHNGDYGTGYGHLSRFAARLAPGTRVAQGQVIGYVGATGLATGPHLHYEVLKDGAEINPQGLKLAFADRLDGAELRRFRQLKAQIDAQRAEPVLAAASQ
jgi:murein DD-endopeptidase MepM/ murein hydrolase activator NlpD